MSTKNPYRVAELVLVKVGNAIAIAFTVLTLGGVLVLIAALCLEHGWGWWTLLLIPGVPAGLALMGLAVAMFWWVVGTVEDKWRDAKYRWEAEQRAALSASTTPEEIK